MQEAEENTAHFRENTERSAAFRTSEHSELIVSNNNDLFRLDTKL